MPRPSWPLAIGLLVLDPGACRSCSTAARRSGQPRPSLPASDGGHELSEPQIAAMIGELERRLEQHPDNAEGWVLLARSDYALGRFAAAADAYAKANALVKDNPDLLADYADALAMAQGRNLAGKPLALVERALAIDPRHRKALALRRPRRWRHAILTRRSPTGIGSLRSCPPGSDEATPGCRRDREARRREARIAARRSGGRGGPRAGRRKQRRHDQRPCRS